MTRWGSALMCLLTACSGRPIGGDAGLDAGTDAAATDAGLDASAWDASCVPLDPPADPARPWGDGPADVFEVEPNDLAPFTDCTACARGEPTGFRVGDTLGGTLSPAAVGTDWDWFVARLTGGSVVELALETDADVRLAVGTMAAATDEAPEGRCCYVGPDRQYMIFERELLGPEGERQLFVPQDGDYFFYVRREDSDARGGPPVAYVLRTRVVDAPRIRGDLGPVCDDLGTSALGFLRFVSEQDVAVRVVARVAPYPNLPIVLAAYDPVEATVTASACPGSDAEGPATLCFGASPGHEHWVVIDRRTAPSDGRYELEVTTTHDDAIAPLREGSVYWGNIAAITPDPDPRVDADYFSVRATGERALRVEVTAPPGSDLLPALEAYEPVFMGGGGPHVSARPEGGTAALEIPAGVEGWLVRVDDVRNLPDEAHPEGPLAPLGGPTLRYRLEATQAGP